VVMAATPVPPPSGSPTVRINLANRGGHAMAAPRKTGPVAATSERNTK
jgi:hypothetical protein